MADLLHGQTVDITGEKDDFYQINYNGQTGYVSKEYIDVSNEGETTVVNLPDNNETSENTTTETPEDNNTTSTPTETPEEIINTKASLKGDAKMYALPLFSSAIIGEIGNNSEITIITTACNWAYVLTDKGYGWITLNKTGLATENSDFSTPVTTPTEPTETTKDPEPTQEPEPTTSSLEYPKTMYVNATDVILRSDASTSSSMLKTLDINTEVNAMAKEGDWYKVEVNGTEGYIASWLLSNSKS